VRTREKREIIAEILRTSLSYVTLTKIMYDVFMSYPQTKRYLQLLQKNNLLKYDDKSRLYVTTDKGKRYLQRSDEITQILFSKKELETIKEISHAPENKR
jgi:predicted transcriptional regulator